MLEGEAIAAFRASPLHGGTTKSSSSITIYSYFYNSYIPAKPWLVWQSGLGWIMQTLWVTLKFNFGPDDA